MKLLAGKFTSRSFMLLNRKPLMSAINSLKFLSAFVSINFPSIDFNCTFLCIRKSLEFPLPVFVFQFCFVFRKMWIFHGKNDFFPEFPAAEEKKKNFRAVFTFNVIETTVGDEGTQHESERAIEDVTQTAEREREGENHAVDGWFNRNLFLLLFFIFVQVQNGLWTAIHVTNSLTFIALSTRDYKVD